MSTPYQHRCRKALGTSSWQQILKTGPCDLSIQLQDLETPLCGHWKMGHHTHAHSWKLIGPTDKKIIFCSLGKIFLEKPLRMYINILFKDLEFVFKIPLCPHIIRLVESHVTVCILSPPPRSLPPDSPPLLALLSSVCLYLLYHLSQLWTPRTQVTYDVSY